VTRSSILILKLLLKLLAGNLLKFKPLIYFSFNLIIFFLLILFYLRLVFLLLFEMLVFVLAITGFSIDLLLVYFY
jgi:hypothetical protein